MAKLFLLGSTGHIGGAILYSIVKQFPQTQIVALVRDQHKSQKLEQAFPGLRAVVDDLKNVDLIESESRAAGIVINASPDQLPESPIAIRAALRGLTSRPTRGFYIQTSGAFLVGEESNGERTSEKIWSDIEDIERITTMPSDRYHQHTDQLVRDAATGVNVAIVSPTVVYGLSPSVENRIPITIRDIVSTARQLSAGFTMSQGRNILGYIHVDDLADIYIRLFHDALNGEAYEYRLWGPQAYYFANSEELTFIQYMQALAKVLLEKGIISTEVIKQIGPETDASELKLVYKTALIHGYGANVRCRSERAKILLDWKPRARGVYETLPEVVNSILSRNL